MAKLSKKEKKDSEILFPDVSLDFTIGKVTAKPFTYGDVIDLSKNFETILSEFKARDLSINMESLSLPDVLSIYIFIGETALPILCRVTNLPEEEIRKLSMVESAQLMIVVIQQNVEVFMRFFGLYLSKMGMPSIPSSKSENADGKIEENQTPTPEMTE
jgi:hypothetical protein